MSSHARHSRGPAWDGARISIAHTAAPIAVCDDVGNLLAASPDAVRLLRAVGADSAELPRPMPSGLWDLLRATPFGHAVEWRAVDVPTNACLGCTRYRVGNGHSILLMREVSAKHVALSRRLHQQRLEVTGRLVAMIAHDLRAPLASIVFNADVLATRVGRLTAEALGESAHEIRAAAQRLQWTVDGLLDFARLGPKVDVDVSLEEVFDRLSGLLRPAFREGAHHLVTRVRADAAWVRGNPLVIEQILVNLAMNATEASDVPVWVEVETERADDHTIRIVVRDNGPGIPADVRSRVFEPFFTTKPRGTGLGLTSAREAARELDGDLELLTSGPEGGTIFALVLPAGEESDTRSKAS